MKIYGHQKIIDYFKKVIENNSLSPSYLFSGQEGIGKFSLAVFLSERIAGKSDILCLCQESEFKKRLKVPQINFSHSLKIEEIRRVINFVNYSSLGRRKAIILDDFHLATNESQNAFLKTLEESRKEVIFFLISCQKEKILPTIISRVQAINFFPLKDEEIRNFLIEKLSFDKEKSQKIAFYSFGRVSRALRIAKNFSLWQKKRKEFLMAFSPKIKERFSLLEKLEKEENWQEFLEEIFFFLSLYFKKHLERKTALLLKKFLTFQYLLNSYNLNKKWQMEYFILSLPAISNFYD